MLAKNVMKNNLNVFRGVLPELFLGYCRIQTTDGQKCSVAKIWVKMNAL